LFCKNQDNVRIFCEFEFLYLGFNQLYLTLCCTSSEAVDLLRLALSILLPKLWV